MKRILISIAILLIILAASISLLSSKMTETNIQPIKISETHSYTKAICTETNYCQDYHIRCDRNQVLKISPITGAAIHFQSDWQDPRDESVRNIFCG